MNQATLSPQNEAIMLDTHKPSYQPDPRLEQARAAIAERLGVPAAEVMVSVGRIPSDQIRSILPEGAQELVIRVHKLGLDLEKDRITDEIRGKLAQIPVLAENAQMVSEKQVAPELLAKLRDATAGTNFNPSLFEWPGFKPDIIGRGFEIGDYALQNVLDNAYGVTLNLHFPHATGESPAAAVERFAELTKGRVKGGIQEILTDRVLKYARINLTKRGLNGEEADKVKQGLPKGKSLDEALANALEDKIKLVESKIRSDMGKLQITINTDRDNLQVALRSPEQTAAYNKAEPRMRDHTFGDAPPNADELRSTNPLTSRIVGLTTETIPATDEKPAEQPQLHKALARSFLFDKNKNTAPDALQIFGRSDMKAALIKEIHLRVLPKHPEKKAQLEAILDSELFKNHDLWYSAPGKAGMSNSEPVFDRVAGNNDTMEISFTFRTDKDPQKNKLLQVVSGLAALAPKQEQPAHCACMEKPQTAMGVALPPAAIEKATMDAINQLLAGYESPETGRG